ncbi:hypothetical protein B1R42_05060 [Trueperella pyogenes]|nr:hypothetical protein DBV13_04565 [Trueperella pyogenes]AZR00807.1 hypothetical protein EB776_05540 [Trueperella pyogenes]AZR02056.1 hypothetical protein EB775_01230 [Trueperella pyogenes]OQD38178.1 hypothetical protein B1R42_05060 [Trueperella pyogenes]
MLDVNDMIQTLAQSLGWLGAVLYLGGYYLVSTGRLAADSLRYQLICITSGVFMVILASATGAWPSLFSNLVFILIGFYVVLTVKRAYLKQLVATKTRRTRHKVEDLSVPVADDAQISFNRLDEAKAGEALAK